MAVNGAETIVKIKSLVCKICLYQDDFEWHNWLELCSDDFNCYIRVYSPEIQADKEYMGGSRQTWHQLPIGCPNTIPIIRP